MYKILLFVIFSFRVSYGQIDVFEACRNGNISSLDSIVLSSKEWINSINENGHSPLILATYYNQINVVKWLIENGADVNYTSSDGSALHGACYKGLFDITVLLVSNGAKINEIDSNGTTPIIYSTIFNHNAISKYLFNQNADINYKDMANSSALDYAISLDNIDLIQLYKTKPLRNE